MQLSSGAILNRLASPVRQPRDSPHVLEGLRARGHAGRLCARRRSSSASASTPCASPSRSITSRRSRRTEAIRHQDDVARRAEWNAVERLWMEEELVGARLRRRRQPGELLLGRAWGTGRGRCHDRARARGRGGAPGKGLGAPGYLRVTYGSRAENERFVEALRACLAERRERGTASSLDRLRATCYKPSMRRQAFQPLHLTPASAARSGAPPFIAGDLARRSAGRRFSALLAQVERHKTGPTRLGRAPRSIQDQRKPSRNQQ